MAADERLLAAVRRFWTKEEVETAYEAIFNAYSQALVDVTVIVQKSSESESAQGQVVVSREDYRQWMDVLEARLQELEAETGGGGVKSPVEHAGFGSRWARS